MITTKENYFFKIITQRLYDFDKLNINSRLLDRVNVETKISI
jgi:hypothetical protein